MLAAYGAERNKARRLTGAASENGVATISLHLIRRKYNAARSKRLAY